MSTYVKQCSIYKQIFSFLNAIISLFNMTKGKSKTNQSYFVLSTPVFGC